MYQTDAEAEMFRLSHAGKDISEHLLTLYGLTLETDARRVLDLGVAEGLSTIAFLCGVHRTGGHVWSCDGRDLPDTRAKIAALNLASRWTFLVMDDRELGAAPEVCCGGGAFDIISIDTSHEAPHTMAELVLFPKLVRVGGYLVMHDTVTYESTVLSPLRHWLQRQSQNVWGVEHRRHNNGLAILQRNKAQ